MKTFNGKKAFVFLITFFIITMSPYKIYGAGEIIDPGAKYEKYIKTKPQRLFKKFSKSEKIQTTQRSAEAALDNPPAITSEDLLEAYSPQNTLVWYFIPEVYKDSLIQMDIGDVDYLSPQHWVMPDVQLKESDSVKGIPVSQIPNKDLFPDATHSKKYTYTAGNYYQIYQISESMVNLEGIVDSVDDHPYTDKVDVLITPLPLDFYTEFIVSTIYNYPDSTSTELIENIAPQGYGTLTTPEGDLEVLKIFNDYLQRDYDSTGTLINEKRIRLYKFIGKEGHMLTISLKDGEPSSGVTGIEGLEYLRIDYNTTGISGINIPEKYLLSQNYPNPFNPETNIEYSVANREYVSLKVYDVLGREVAALVNEYREPGNYSVVFNNQQLTSGIYFYTLSAGNYSETKKMIMLK